MKTGVEKCGNYIDSKITQGSRPRFQNQPKRNGCISRKTPATSSTLVRNMREKSLTLSSLRPRSTRRRSKIKSTTQKIIQSSTSQVSHYLLRTSQSVRQSYWRCFRRPCQRRLRSDQGTRKPRQKIITKKYGDDVIKTMTGENEEKKESEGESKTEEKVELKEEEASSSAQLNKTSEDPYPKIDK